MSQTATAEPQASATTTEILGYFNPNGYPIALQLSELRMTVNLAKGEFVVDRSVPPRKVNDPRLDRYVGPYRLARELSTSGPVPIVRVNTGQVGVTPPQGFTATNTVPKPKAAAPLKPFVPTRKKPTPATPPERPAQVQPGSSGEVIVPPSDGSNRPSHFGMTMEQARTRGLVKAVKPLAEGILDNNTATAAVNAPKMSLTMDGTPAKKLPPTSRLAAAAQGALAEDASLAEVLEAANSPLPDPALSLPEPEVEPIGVTPAPQVPRMTRSGKPKPFICLAKDDGSAFVYRSELLRYVEKKFPDQVDELMAPYPETR